MRRWLLLGAFLAAACWPLVRQRPDPELLELEPDTTIVVLRVFNYQAVPVTAFVDAPNERRRRVGTVMPFHEGYFVLPSPTIRWLQVFHVTVEAADRSIHPYRTGLITRNPVKITMVFVVVGEGPGQPRYSGPQS